MQRFRGLFALVLVVGAVTVVAVSAHADDDPPQEGDLSPFLECAAPIDANTFEVHLGALNDSNTAIVNPSVNAFFPSTFNPPTTFSPASPSSW